MLHTAYMTHFLNPFITCTAQAFKIAEYFFKYMPHGTSNKVMKNKHLEILEFL
jgi:hypothetical protein